MSSSAARGLLRPAAALVASAVGISIVDRFARSHAHSMGTTIVLDERSARGALPPNHLGAATAAAGLAALFAGAALLPVPGPRTLRAIGAGLVVGGTGMNLYDRMHDGQVENYIVTSVRAFNLPDAAIGAGFVAVMASFVALAR